MVFNLRHLARHASAGVAVVACSILGLGQIVHAATASESPAVAVFNNFDHGDIGADLSVNNSYLSGDPFSYVTASGGLTFDTAHAATAAGSSLRVSKNWSYLSWNTNVLGTHTTPVHASVDVWFDSVPTTTVRLIQFNNETSRVAHIEVLGGTGRIRVVDGSYGSTASTATIVPGHWSRISASISPGEQVAATLATLDDTLSEANVAETVAHSPSTLAAAVTTVRFGSNTGAASDPHFWLDNVTARTDHEAGALVAPAATTDTSVDFEDASLSAFNRITGFGGGTSISADAALSGTYSLRFDQSVAGAESQTGAEMTQAVHGTDKRYAKVSFLFRHDGIPADNVNQPVLTIRNTNYVSANGGGHLNIWVDPDDGTFRGDLMARDSFRSAPGLFQPQTTYLIEAAVAYNADGTSSAQVRVNETMMTPLTSTTIMPAAYPPAGSEMARLRSVLLGSASAKASYQATYDDVHIQTSATPLGGL